MNKMLGDEELARLLNEAAGSFAVPEASFDAPIVTGRKPVWRRPWLQAGAAATVLLLGAFVAGSLADPNSSIKVVPSQLGSAGSSADRTATALEGGGTTGGVAAAPGVAQGYAGSADSSKGSVSAAGLDATRIVKTGSLSLLVDEGKVSATVARVQALVAGARGYVAESNSEESGKHPTATLTVRIPAESFEKVLAQVRALPVEVLSESSSGKDVTATYADTQAQIQSLRAARGRYLAILAGAKTIAETLTVQQRVDEVQGQIDRLEGQRRLLADQSDLATLTVSVSEDRADLFTEPSGWSEAWDDAKHGFTSGVQSLISGSGRTLLVLILLAAAGLLGRAGWRLARRRLV